METCDRGTEEGKADHGALLLLLCAMLDLEKHQDSENPGERSRLFVHAN
jgi:hypothetical protein